MQPPPCARLPYRAPTSLTQEQSPYWPIDGDKPASAHACGAEVGQVLHPARGAEGKKAYSRSAHHRVNTFCERQVRRLDTTTHNRWSRYPKRP